VNKAGIAYTWASFKFGPGFIAPMLSHLFIVRWLIRLRHSLRYGGSKRTWKSYFLPGQIESDQAFLLIGGLSSNATTTNRYLAQKLHQFGVLTWSRNLPGHTGRFYDFSRSRFWHWVADCVFSIRKLVNRFKKRDLILVGHSTGGLVVLAVLILKNLFPAWLVGQREADVNFRGVLIFPPFQLQRRRDAQLLWVVAILYYIVCPLSFLYIGLMEPGMWALAIIGFVFHIRLVPKIYVPSGDQRARQSTPSRINSLISESVLLALMSIYFVSGPPLLALLGSGWVSVIAFSLFMLTLLIPLIIIPKNVADPTSTAGPQELTKSDDSTSNGEHMGFRWLPVITVSNLMILQFVLKRFLRYCKSPLLVMQGGNDRVVVVSPTWIKALQPNVQFMLLRHFPHSDLSPEQQAELARIIHAWCRGEIPITENRGLPCLNATVSN
jgi:pimeloyl-ACP methyl ester carboxylesterase